MDILAKNIAQFNEVLASQIPAETLQAFQKSVGFGRKANRKQKS